MQFARLKALQQILLLNWIACPVLAIWVWVKAGLFAAVEFVFVWLILDAIWDWLTGQFIFCGLKNERG